MSAAQPRLNLFSFTGETRTLHLTWFAFFLTFVVWFNHAPLIASIRETMGLTDRQVKTLLILNVALTIPARISIGMLVDRFGPRLVYSALMFISSFICFLFAMADTYQELALARFLLGVVGAGFVVGIRMISDWFPAQKVGLAEGIYAGWGNFGSAAAAMTLPTVALFCGGDDGWRYAVGITGAVILVYSYVYYSSVTDTPKNYPFFKPNKAGALEVTSKGDFFFHLVMNIPLYVALGVLAWRISTLGLLTAMGVNMICLSLVVVYLLQAYQIYKVNAGVFSTPAPAIHRYKFKQVAILGIIYLVTFGSELAVVSMLPLFFLDTFDVSGVVAGLLASGFAFMNLVARPSGGWISDNFGRKRTLMFLLLGLAIGYVLMSQINSSWAISVAVLVTMACAFFVQAGDGAVFAAVPLVQRRLTGQIAGIVGAYGTAGAVTFLTVVSFVSPQMLFLVIAGAAVLALLAVSFLDEQQGALMDVLPEELKGQTQ